MQASTLAGLSFFHTFASRLVMADVNIHIVQKLMRHKTLTMTLRYYPQRAVM